MNAYLNRVDEIQASIDQYFALRSGSPGVLLMDGTGMLSSYQNTIFSLIGWERLHRFEEIHLVSGSAYAYFIFAALKEGAFKWTANDIWKWNVQVQSWHGIQPIISLAKFLTFRFHNIPAGRKGGHFRACDEIFKGEFRERQLKDFSEKIRVWSFNDTEKRLIQLGSEPSHKNLNVSQLISMAASVPSVFGSHFLENQSYIDAMYAPGYPQFKYKLFDGRDVLHFNMFKNGFKRGINSIKIHEHSDGKNLVNRDFLRFLGGIRNNQFDEVTKYALFGVQR